jgi:hypothetical protein
MGEVLESRYKIERGDNYFIVRGGEGRVPVRVGLAEGGATLTIDHADKKGPAWTTHFGTTGLIQGRLLIKKVAESIMSEWEGDKEKKKISNIWGMGKLRTWASGKTGKALARRIKEERIHLVEKANPTIVAVQKAVFAANGIMSNDALDPDFYDRANPYYIKDIIQYRAAAMTTFDFNEIYTYNYDRSSILNDDWRKVYSFDKDVYGSLRKTLTNLPGGIPINILKNLRQIRLQRPIYSRRELIFMISCGSHHDWSGRNYNRYIGISEDIKHVLLNATADEITRAAKKLGEHRREPINLRKAFNVHFVAGYIMDAAPALTHNKNGNVVGLMEKAIEYHRQASWNSCGIPADTLTALPSLPLPTNKGIIFLKNVREIVEEGEKQHHCIASYARQAVSGNSFLFHIEYAGETASCQVDRWGRVVQCHGPYNRSNKASEWGRRVLNKWGESLNKLLGLSCKQIIVDELDGLDRFDENDMPF